MQSDFKEKAIPFIQVDPESKGTVFISFRVYNK